MASRAAKVTFGVVGGVVGLIVIVVIAAIGWVMFRPLLVGDYNHTYGYMRTVNTLNDVPLAAMVASVGLGAPAQGAEQYSNRIANTISQIGVVTEEVDGALTSRAGEKDDELRGLLEDLDAAYATMSDSFASWDADGYALVAQAADACTSPDAAACAAAAQAAAGSGASVVLIGDLLAGAETVASGGSPDALAAARTAIGDETAALWSAVEEAAAAASDYLVAHGDVDE